MKRSLVFILVTFVAFVVSCENDKDFAYDLDLLIGTKWGVPQVSEGSYDLAAPTVFKEDGTVTFGGTRTDTWDVRDSHSLFIQRRSEIWQVISLTETQMAVDILSYPHGKFKASCVYEPVE